MTSNNDGTKKNPLRNLIAGGIAGLVESSVCHPLDTIKTRMQLRKNNINTSKIRTPIVDPLVRLPHGMAQPSLRQMSSLAAGPITSSSSTAAASHAGTVEAALGPLGTAGTIVRREGFFALYKGLTAVYTGIIPKMAIRFLSFERYKDILADHTSLGRSTMATFTAGLASGLTEAILVVTPAEVCKIRMQSQTAQQNKYKNVFQTGMVIAREEGVGALYKGVIPTMLRQGCNQAVNFTAYNSIKKAVLERQQSTELASWQSLTIGGLSGGMGPLVNNPLDVVKTRLQRQVVHEGQIPKYTGLVQACFVIGREEGPLALWKGITPRLMRIMPGQAITFMTYEAVTSKMDNWRMF